MKFPLVRVLPILVLFACVVNLPAAPPASPIAKPPPTRADIAAAEYARTAEITALCTDGSDGPHEVSGTAVAVGGDVFLTAFHVVNCSPMMIGVMPSGGSDYLEAKLEAVTSFDVARLRVAGAPKVGPVVLAARAVGDVACVVYAIPERGRKCGELNPTPPLPDQEDDDSGTGSNNGATEMSISIPAEHGHSGAGIWDEHGALMGIVTQMRFCGGDDSTSASSCGTRGASIGNRHWLAGSD